MHLSIRSMLILLALVAASLVGVVGWVGHSGIEDCRLATEGALTNGSLLREQMTADMMHDALKADVLSLMLAADAEDRKKGRAELSAHADEFIDSLEKLRKGSTSPEVQTAITTVRPALNAYLAEAQRLGALAETDRQSAGVGLPAFTAAYDSLASEMEKLGDTVQAAGQKIASDARTGSEHSLRLMTIVGGVAVLGLMLGNTVVIVAIRRSIQSPVRRCADVMKAAAAGDLTKRVGVLGTAELGALGTALDSMIDSMSDLIGRMSAMGDSVASAAASIAAAGEETAASNQQIADRAARADASASEASRAARAGGEMFGSVITDMNTVSGAVQAGAASVSTLGTKSDQIAAMVGVINDIAEQTNLLALNAAIEAARAGEHGRGFAVVADEVRKLADRTGQSTRQIVESIAGIQKETGDAVARMQAGLASVESGVARASDAGRGMNGIVAGAEQVAEMIRNINASTRESGAAVQESARIAAELSDNAAELQRMFAGFKVA